MENGKKLQILQTKFNESYNDFQHAKKQLIKKPIKKGQRMSTLAVYNEAILNSLTLSINDYS